MAERRCAVSFMLSVTYAEFHLFWVSIILSDTYKPFMMSVVMLDVIMVSVVKLNIIMLSVLKKKTSYII